MSNDRWIRLAFAGLLACGTFLGYRHLSHRINEATATLEQLRQDTSRAAAQALASPKLQYQAPGLRDQRRLLTAIGGLAAVFFAVGAWRSGGAKTRGTLPPNGA